MPRASLGAAEQLEAALEILERELEVALAAPHAAHLVERDRRLRLARGDPRQPQHALERAERRLEVADQLVDRAEVVPQVDARRDDRASPMQASARSNSRIARSFANCARAASAARR